MLLFPGDIPGAGADSGLPSYQKPSVGGTNSRPNQSGTRPALGQSSKPSFGTGSGSSGSNSRPSANSDGSRPSFGGGSSGSRPSFGGGSAGSRPGFGGGSAGSRPSFGGGSTGSRPGFGGAGSTGSRPGGAGSRPSSISGTSGSAGGSQEISGANESNNFGFPERLGKAGIDFPIYDRMNMPITSFTCQDKENGGYVLASINNYGAAL